MKTSTAICTREHSAAYFFQKLSSGCRSFGSASVPHRAALSRCFMRPTPACSRPKRYIFVLIECWACLFTLATQCAVVCFVGKRDLSSRKTGCGRCAAAPTVRRCPARHARNIQFCVIVALPLPACSPAGTCIIQCIIIWRALTLQSVVLRRPERCRALLCASFDNQTRVLGA